MGAGDSASCERRADAGRSRRPPPFPPTPPHTGGPCDGAAHHGHSRRLRLSSPYVQSPSAAAASAALFSQRRRRSPPLPSASSSVLHGHNLGAGKIVRLFKEDGKDITMTEDGVNDAPVLKLPGISIAMGVAGLRFVVSK